MATKLQKQQALVQMFEANGVTELEDNVKVLKEFEVDTNVLDNWNVVDFTENGSAWSNVIITVLNRTFSIKLRGKRREGKMFCQLCNINYNGTVYEHKVRMMFK